MDRKGSRQKELLDKIRSLEEQNRDFEGRAETYSAMNESLTLMLKNKNDERHALEEKVLLNVKSLIRPYLLKLKKSGLEARQKIFVEIIESNLEEIVSPLSRKLSFDYLGFTPSEIRVATMVKQGKKASEIARLMGISVRTVEGYRYAIRERLGIKGKKVNLRTYLLSFS